MDLRIRNVVNGSASAPEHAILDVANDTFTQFFGLADTSYRGADKVSNKLRHFFWMPTKKVHKGDVIFVWTGVGKDNSVVVNGVNVHHFYWGLASKVWNNTGDAAVLFQIQEWMSTKT